MAQHCRQRQRRHSTSVRYGKRPTSEEKFKVTNFIDTFFLPLIHSNVAKEINIGVKPCAAGGAYFKTHFEMGKIILGWFAVYVNKSIDGVYCPELLKSVFFVHI